MIRSVLLRLYRLAMLAAIVWVIHRHSVRWRLDADAPINVAEVQPLLPSAAKLALDDSDRLGLFVFDASGKRIGYALRTAPISSNIIGYIGPTDTLIVLDLDMRVIGVRIRHSDDTREHVRDVGDDEYFMKTWTGKTWDEVAGMDPKSAGIEGVSGASLTSLCIANSIQHRFEHVNRARAETPAMRWTKGDWGVAACVILAIIFSFTHLRSRTWLRRIFQAGLIGYLGFYNGRILAISLLAGWTQSGVAWRVAPGLALLAAIALFFPWFTRRPIYCSHLCPHGAAQEWMGRISPWRLRLPGGVEAGLRWLAPGLLLLATAAIMVHVPFNLAGVEPFDAYLIRTAGIATILVAVASLIFSAVVPMGYCKYGCPTGHLLAYIRSHGKADRLGARDLIAVLILLAAIGLDVWNPQIRAWMLG